MPAEERDRLLRGSVAEHETVRAPVRTSASHEMKDIPNDFGAHHRLSNSGLVQASNTMYAGPLKVRVTTSSRSDFRSTVVRFFMEWAHSFFLRPSTFSFPF